MSWVVLSEELMVVICSTMMMKTACERLLMSFIFVVAVALLSAPFYIKL